MDLEVIPSLDVARDEWGALAERADNIFATPEWCHAWWRHYGSGEPLLGRCPRPDGSLAALVPLYRTRIGPARVLRLIGNGPGDQLGPICAPGDRAAVARALRAGLTGDRLAPWDAFLAERLPAGQAWAALLGGSVAGTEVSPVLRARSRSFEEILASRSRNFRQQVRRRERKLLERHGLRYRLTTDPDRLAGDLTTLVALHKARWGAESAAFGTRREAFHRDFAAAALERGWLRLWIAEAANRPVAALYGFRFAGSELYYQSGRDPAWNREAVGFVLLAHAIREAIDGGMREYRLLRGDEAYKWRFADHADMLETVVTGRGPLRRAAASIASRLAARRRPRRLLARASAVD